MTQPKLYPVRDLTTEDFLCVPGLPEVRFAIKRISLGSPTTLITSGANLILSNPEREVWAIKKEDLNGDSE